MWRVTPFTSTFNHFSSILLDPQVSFVCWTILLLFFTCTNIIDSGEPDPSSPDLLYFLCVPLSGFLFLPPLSFSLSISLSLSSPLTAGLLCINAEPESGCQTESCFVSSLAPAPWWGPTVCDNGNKRKQKEGAKMTVLCLRTHAVLCAFTAICINRFDWRVFLLQVDVCV